MKWRKCIGFPAGFARRFENGRGAQTRISIRFHANLLDTFYRGIYILHRYYSLGVSSGSSNWKGVSGLNKGELVEAVAATLDASRAQADRVVNAVMGAVEKGLKKDKKVSIVGFGTFEVRKRKARSGRNPRTGEEIKIKAGKSVGFKAGKALKDAV